MVCLAAIELAVSCVHQISLRTYMHVVMSHGVCGMQGFRRGHSGLVALKAVNTALIMLYCHSKPQYLSLKSVQANAYHPANAACKPSVPMPLQQNSHAGSTQKLQHKSCSSGATPIICVICRTAFDYIACTPAFDYIACHTCALTCCFLIVC